MSCSLGIHAGEMGDEGFSAAVSESVLEHRTPVPLGEQGSLTLTVKPNQRYGCYVAKETDDVATLRILITIQPRP